MNDASIDEKIHRIMTEFPGCSRVTASNFLELYGNDVDLAITRYRHIKDLLPEDPHLGDDDNQSQASSSHTDEATERAAHEIPDGRNDDVDEVPSWMPKVPTLPVDNDFMNGDPPDPSHFEIHKLLGAIQAGRLDAVRLRSYLRYYSKETLDINLNATVDGYPAMFYIVSTNDTALIREWMNSGGDPNVTWGPDALPLIAFSIFIGGITMRQASETLATLLRFHANPHAIPKAFYDPYCRDLPPDGLTEEELHDSDDDHKRWCTPEVNAYLAKSLNLTQRYLLYRSSKASPSTGREKEVLVRQGAEEVMGLHQMIIAQSIASRWLQKTLLVYLAMQKRKPFILVFAGPSGHGKTELAHQFRRLMSLELEEVDCTNINNEQDLFGPRPPFSGYEKGSLLNNFLVRNAERRCVVFMDEFEKTSKEIHNTLLLPFQSGRYEDRRNGNIVDCSRTIWILATNRLDESIHNFCNANEKALLQSEDHEAQDRLAGKFCRQLRKEFIEHFGAPLTGRTSGILPFIVFSQQEAAVIAHKALMDLEAEVVRTVRLTLNKEDDIYVGNIRIHINNDATVCSTIAREEYDKQTGARSITQAVERIVEDPLVSQYLKLGDDFDENQPIAKFIIDTNVDKEVEVRLAR